MKKLKHFRTVLRLALLVLGLIASHCVQPHARADDADPTIAKARAISAKAVAYLVSQQKPDGTWTKTPREPAAISALVLRAIVADPAAAATHKDAVKKGFDHLLTFQKPDGSIHQGMLANYNTAVSVSALAAAKDPAYKPAIDKAVNYLKSVQWNDAIAGPDGAKIDTGHPWYGGWGYGATGREARPDLSNTAIILEALHDAGVKQEDPAFKRAIAFVTHMQNNSETNNLAWAGNDGGFVYSLDAKGKAGSSAGEYSEAGTPRVRSYGTMTYAGLKSFVYAGLTRDDPRVKAAWKWVTANWSLDENPGMRAGDPKNARAGLFYYYQALSKALGVYGQTAVDTSGGKLDWRIQLIDKMAAIQKPDGSFLGEPKFMEDNPILTTAFAAIALQDAVADLEAHHPK